MFSLLITLLVFSNCYGLGSWKTLVIVIFQWPYIYILYRNKGYCYQMYTVFRLQSKYDTLHSSNRVHI